MDVDRSSPMLFFLKQWEYLAQLYYSILSIVHGTFTHPQLIRCNFNWGQTPRTLLYGLAYSTFLVTAVRHRATVAQQLYSTNGLTVL